MDLTGSAPIRWHRSIPERDGPNRTSCNLYRTALAHQRARMLSEGMTDSVSALSIARDLLRCPSVTPADAGALGVLENVLKGAGFEVHRVTFSEPGAADIDNLYARIGSGAPHITFAGHTDVVPPGDESAWTHGAFSGEVKDGLLVRPRRRRHEGRHRLQRRGCARLSRRKRRPAERLDLVPDHRRRGRHRRQRHREAVAMGGGARREIRSLRIGRTQQCRGTWRLHQGRPPRFAVGHALRRWHPGPCRLSASRVESGAGHSGADRGAERASRSTTAARISSRPISNSPRSMSAIPRAM